jgi:hypothetical protein
MKETEWSQLPNAAHIDRVLASVKAHPDVWDAAWGQAWGQVWDAALDASLEAALEAAWDESRGAAYDAAWRAVWAAALNAARGAIAALIAWDDCAKYLDMPSDKLKVWHALSDDPAAILLLPAVMAFEKINELETI